MSSQHSARTTFTGSYHEQSQLPSSELDPPEGAEWDLLQVTQTAAVNGFQTLFHAALALAERDDEASKRELVRFAEDGSLAKFIGLACRKDIRDAMRSIESGAELNEALCEASQEVYKAEWTEWMKQEGIRTPLKRFSLEHIQLFNVETLYAAWRTKAPFLSLLFETMALGKTNTQTLDEAWDINDKRRRDYRRRCRHITMAISCIGALRSRRVNVVQGMLSYFMYACRVPKRVIMILNKWGVTVSHSSVHRAVRAIGQSPWRKGFADRSGKALLQDLKQLGAQDLAFKVVFDNCTAMASVRDERVHNKSDSLQYTVGYAVAPAVPVPLFERSHVDYGNVGTLKVADFIPPDEDAASFRAVFGHFIAATLGRYCAKRRIVLPKLDFPMPAVMRMDPRQQHKVHVLPTYDLDESQMDDLIEILYRIGDDVGLKDSHIEHCVLSFGGDLYSTVAER
jgi:hypothetical protein